MTRIPITFISIFSFFSTAKADTIDFWHIYYNNIKIQAYNQFSKGVINIKIKDIKETDTLTIKYFNDTPCSVCEAQITIENEGHSEITKGNGLGGFNPIKISVYELLQYHLKHENEHYEVFYQERQSKNPTQRVLIFSIKLE
jgi:hypothetical protein